MTFTINRAEVPYNCISDAFTDVLNTGTQFTFLAVDISSMLFLEMLMSMVFNGWGKHFKMNYFRNARVIGIHLRCYLG